MRLQIKKIFWNSKLCHCEENVFFVWRGNLAEAPLLTKLFFDDYHIRTKSTLLLNNIETFNLFFPNTTYCQYAIKSFDHEGWAGGAVRRATLKICGKCRRLKSIPYCHIETTILFFMGASTRLPRCDKVSRTSQWHIVVYSHYSINLQRISAWRARCCTRLRLPTINQHNLRRHAEFWQWDISTENLGATARLGNFV